MSAFQLRVDLYMLTLFDVCVSPFEVSALVSNYLNLVSKDYYLVSIVSLGLLYS